MYLYPNICYNQKYNLTIMKLLFSICILVRLLVAYGVYKNIFPRLFCLLISIGFMYQFIVKTRTIGAFNNKVWWDSLRPVHAFLYFLTFLFYDYRFVVFDTILGLVAFIYKNSSLYNTLNGRI